MLLASGIFLWKSGSEKNIQKQERKERFQKEIEGGMKFNLYLIYLFFHLFLLVGG